MCSSDLVRLLIELAQKYRQRCCFDFEPTTTKDGMIACLDTSNIRTLVISCMQARIEADFPVHGGAKRLVVDCSLRDFEIVINVNSYPIKIFFIFFSEWRT